MGARADFLDAMAACVTGVTVVTTEGERGPIGRTVSSMASASADPPLLLVCLHRSSPLRDAIVVRGAFAVSVLGAHQAALADAFAGRNGRYVFDARQWSPGVPVLADAAASFECELADVTEAGSHSILLGTVLRSRTGSAAPLAYSRRTYTLAEAA